MSEVPLFTDAHIGAAGGVDTGGLGDQAEGALSHTHTHKPLSLSLALSHTHHSRSLYLSRSLTHTWPFSRRRGHKWTW